MYTPRVEHVLGMANTRTDDFNCWGATLFIANGTSSLSWVDDRTMGEWLMQNCKPIPRSSLREGDIVALFRDKRKLVHTAYYVGDNKFVHKLGRNVARLEPLSRVLKEYSDSANGYIFFRKEEVCV
jgi:cell wall-associated NlpC family hydrolase